MKFGSWCAPPNKKKKEKEGKENPHDRIVFVIRRMRFAHVTHVGDSVYSEDCGFDLYQIF